MKVMFVLQIENGKTLNNTYIGFEGRRFETRANGFFCSKFLSVSCSCVNVLCMEGKP